MRRPAGPTLPGGTQVAGEGQAQEGEPALAALGEVKLSMNTVVGHAAPHAAPAAGQPVMTGPRPGAEPQKPAVTAPGHGTPAAGALRAQGTMVGGFETGDSEAQPIGATEAAATTDPLAATPGTGRAKPTVVGGFETAPPRTEPERAEPPAGPTAFAAVSRTDVMAEDEPQPEAAPAPAFDLYSPGTPLAQQDLQTALGPAAAPGAAPVAVQAPTVGMGPAALGSALGPAEIAAAPQGALPQPVPQPQLGSPAVVQPQALTSIRMSPWVYQLGLYLMVVASALTAAVTTKLLPLALGCWLPLAAAAVLWLVFVYRMWSAIQDGQARISPGRAVGLLFVPLLNIYWIFRVLPGYATEYNAYLGRHGSAAPPLSRGLILAAMLVPVANVVLWWIVIGRICRAVNALDPGPQ